MSDSSTLSPFSDIYRYSAPPVSFVSPMTAPRPSVDLLCILIPSSQQIREPTVRKCSPFLPEPDLGPVSRTTHITLTRMLFAHQLAQSTALRVATRAVKAIIERIVSYLWTCSFALPVYMFYMKFLFMNSLFYTRGGRISFQ